MLHELRCLSCRASFVLILPHYADDSLFDDVEGYCPECTDSIEDEE